MVYNKEGYGKIHAGLIIVMGRSKSRKFRSKEKEMIVE